MHKGAIDITGQKFGKLTALNPTDKRKGESVVWDCACDCGNKMQIALNKLKYKSGARSCGCLQKEKASASGKLMVHKKGSESSTYIHGGYKTRIYAEWLNMKARCNYTNSKVYKRYGGRGIKVCDEWEHDFKVFWEWANENGYSDTLTLDRKDVNGNYEPNNCRWITNAAQQLNKRTNRLIEYNGTTKTLTEWARQIGISCDALSKRLRKWSKDRAMTESKNVLYEH